MNIIIDPGHGGIDETGNYTTAPYKMFTFDDGLTIYEGEVNRKIAKNLSNNFLASPDPKEKILFTVKPHNSEDISLKERVDFANKFNPKNTLFIPIHNNAGGGSGFEIYTSKGETKSDKLATEIYNAVKPTYKEYGLPMRKDTFTDGDVDKESQFYVLRKTICPAVLIEGAFFDNRKDAELLKQDNFLKDLSFSIFYGIKNYINK